MSWHMSEKVMVGVIGALIINITVSIGQAWYVIKTLDTDPPIVERVRILELKTSDYGQAVADFKDVLSDVRDLLQASNISLERLETRLDYVEKRLDRK